MQARVVHRQRPLQHPHAVLRALGDYPGRSVRAVTRARTDEGEPVLRCGDASDELAREVALVLGDDFFTLVVAAGPRRETDAIAAHVDATARALRLELGVRRRRYFYAPPAGWHRFSLDGFDTTYLAPTHPRTPGALAVSAAVPSRGSLAGWWTPAERAHLTAQLGIALPATPLCDDAIVAGPAGTSGRRVVVALADDTCLELVCLADAAYWYPFALLAAADAMAAHSAQLATLLATVEPLAPLAVATRNPTRTAHWFAR